MNTVGEIEATFSPAGLFSFNLIRLIRNIRGLQKPLKLWVRASRATVVPRLIAFGKRSPAFRYSDFDIRLPRLASEKYVTLRQESRSVVLKANAASGSCRTPR